jgi:hypothetical protein
MRNQTSEIIKKLNEIHKELSDLTSQVVNSRKRAFSKDATKEDKSYLLKLESQAAQLLEESHSLTKELQIISGIPDELLEAMEANDIYGDTEERYDRRDFSSHEIESTNTIETILSESIEKVKARVNIKWLHEEAKKNYRLNYDFLNQPLSIVRGLRIESEYRNIHRFAQGILVSEDFLNEHTLYDFFAGAMLVPQLASFVSKIEALNEISGDVNERLKSLWMSDSSLADPTIYELLVAASCVHKGLKLEFIPARYEKTPDLRVHDFYVPLVIECKRKQNITEYEKNECAILYKIFMRLHEACLRKGLTGIFVLESKAEAEKLPIGQIVDCALRQQFSYLPKKPVNYDWGHISFIELPRSMKISPTKLYSPNFLSQVFGWSTDVPEYDGIICKVTSPEDFFLDFVKAPVALKWTISNPDAIRKKARTISSLFGDAMKQVPVGEAGIIYVCYQEGTRPEVADDRTNFMLQEFREWRHNAGILVPISYVNRLYPRPLDDGSPDLIENTLRLCSENYGDPVWFTQFPSSVFTK